MPLEANNESRRGLLLPLENKPTVGSFREISKLQPSLLSFSNPYNGQVKQILDKYLPPITKASFDPSRYNIQATLLYPGMNNIEKDMYKSFAFMSSAFPNIPASEITRLYINKKSGKKAYGKEVRRKHPINHFPEIKKKTHLNQPLGAADLSLSHCNKNKTEIQQLKVLGANAPGYQCRWESIKLLPEVNNENNYDDREFTNQRIQEVLKSEGVIHTGEEMMYGHNSLYTSSVSYFIHSQIGAAEIIDDLASNKSVDEKQERSPGDISKSLALLKSRHRAQDTLFKKHK